MSSSTDLSVLTNSKTKQSELQGTADTVQETSSRRDSSALIAECARWIPHHTHRYWTFFQAHQTSEKHPQELWFPAKSGVNDTLLNFKCLPAMQLAFWFCKSGILLHALREWLWCRVLCWNYWWLCWEITKARDDPTASCNQAAGCQGHSLWAQGMIFSMSLTLPLEYNRIDIASQSRL